MFFLVKRMHACKLGKRSGDGGKRDRKHNRTAAAAKEKRAVACSSAVRGCLGRLVSRGVSVEGK
jgi:hypothetical protein